MAVYFKFLFSKQGYSHRASRGVRSQSFAYNRLFLYEAARKITGDKDVRLVLKTGVQKGSSYSFSLVLYLDVFKNEMHFPYPNLYLTEVARFDDGIVE